MGSNEKELSRKNNQDICKVHKKPLDVVCINDLVKICASCAIFGAHKGHDFKSLEEVEAIRLEYSSSVLDIMDKKQTIEKKASSGEIAQ